MCSQSASPWVKVFQAVLLIKLPWGFMNNQGLFVFPRSRLTLGALQRSIIYNRKSLCLNVCWNLCSFREAWVANITANLFFFSLWSSKGLRASDLQLEDLICYFSTHLLSISDVSTVGSATTAARLSQALGCFPSTETAAVVPQALLDVTHCLYLPMDLACYR